MTIYLDHNATTPVAPEVMEAVTGALARGWGNPSSSHPPGQAAHQMVLVARQQVAALLGCGEDEIVFTSGGTEADNLAIIGAARARREKGLRLVISAVEHPAVDAACAALEREGFTTVRVPVTADGRVEAERFIEALTPDTAVASLMHANNETGALQPVHTVAAAARRRGIPLHTDAAQSAGKLPVRVDDLGVDLLTLAGHKLYGPKGSGALYVRRGTPLHPLFHGAPQEGGRRPGTENTPGIAGLGAACALASVELTERAEYGRRLVRRLLEGLRRENPAWVINGPEAMELRLPNTINVSLPGLDATRLAASLEGVAVSAGAACHSANPEPSRVLTAMGLSGPRALGALRLSTGRGNTEAEMDEAARLITAAVLAAASSQAAHRSS